MPRQHALALFSNLKSALGADLAPVGKALNEQLVLIRNADPALAKRAIYVGIALLVVKQSVKHGQFEKWIEQHIEGRCRRQVAYYMKLALAALDEKRVKGEALHAVPVHDIEAALSISKGPAVQMRAAIDSFVGESSLAELLAEYCGKTTTGRREKDDGEEDSQAKETITVQDRFNELDSALQLVRKTTADKAVWMSLTKQQHDDIRAAAVATAEQVTTLYNKTHGRVKR